LQGEFDAAAEALTEDQATSRVKPQTPVTAASQTAIDFTGIPAWVNRVTVLLAGLSTNGTSELLIQIGDSGGIESTGYLSTVMGTSGAGLGHASYTTGFGWLPLTAADVFSGRVTISRQSGNQWVADGMMKRTTSAMAFVAGDKTLSDTLTQLRITTGGGVDTFDAGSVNIAWE
jgi:hypothetical protein